MKRVIIIVLAILFTFPFLTTSSYSEEEESYQFGIELIDSFEKYSPAFNQTFDNFIEEHKGFKSPLVSLSAYDKSWLDDDFDITLRRSKEIKLVALDDEGNIAAVFDKKFNQ